MPPSLVLEYPIGSTIIVEELKDKVKTQNFGTVYKGQFTPKMITITVMITAAMRINNNSNS